MPVPESAMGTGRGRWMEWVFSDVGEDSRGSWNLKAGILETIWR